MYKLGWFSTGRDKAARDLLKAVNSSIKLGEIEAEIAFVFSNRTVGQARESDRFLGTAASYHIPVICVPSRPFRWAFSRFEGMVTDEAAQASLFTSRAGTFPEEIEVMSAAGYRVPLFDPFSKDLSKAKRPPLVEGIRVPFGRPRLFKQKRIMTVSRLYQKPLFPWDSYQIPLVPPQPSPRLPSAFEPWRCAYDRKVIKYLENIKNFRSDLYVLAGYMLIVSKEMCQRYNMINLHPAAPGGPAGTWQEVIWQLIENEAEETGVMMHLVAPELDKGPPVTYCTFPIRGKPFDRYWAEIKGKNLEEIKREQGENNPLFKVIRKHGLAKEFPLIISTLKAFSQGEVKIIDGKVVDAEGRAIKGYNMADEINELVRRVLS